jgi:hypothetical protein
MRALRHDHKKEGQPAGPAQCQESNHDSNLRDDGFVHELSADLELTETNERILQEVSCAADWSEVADILHQHRKHYYGLPPLMRERLNERIKDLMCDKQ